jgi:Protein of unknown function (DUF2909)
MQQIVWLVVLVGLVAIVGSLGSALWHLSRNKPGEDDGGRLVRALTVRITLSIALFALLMLAWYFGLITPHPLQMGAPAPQ